VAEPKIVVYLTDWCPYCARARGLLESKGAQFEAINIDERPEARVEMTARSGRRSVPQIFIGDTHVGGCDDLYALDAAGGLDPLLKSGA
jgi:glutaredoxin 3